MKILTLETGIFGQQLTFDFIRLSWLRVSIIIEWDYPEKGFDVRLLTCHRNLWFFLNVMIAGHAISFRIMRGNC